MLDNLENSCISQRISKDESKAVVVVVGGGLCQFSQSSHSIWTSYVVLIPSLWLNQVSMKYYSPALNSSCLSGHQTSLISQWTWLYSVQSPRQDRGPLGKQQRVVIRWTSSLVPSHLISRSRVSFSRPLTYSERPATWLFSTVLLRYVNLK